MLEGCRILALIPARGGSKGIKNKNIVDLCGKPLLAYTVEAAIASKYIDDVIVTTDSLTIAEVAIQYGAQVPFLRPEHLAQDTSTTLVGVLHAIEQLKTQKKNYDILVLLQPTSPLRDVIDIDSAVETFFSNGRRALVSISEANDHPLLMRTITGNGRMEALLSGVSTCRRQDMSKVYRVNGSIYINNVKELNENTSFNDNPVPYLMTREHSVDIDELSDLVMAQYFLKQNI